MSKLQSYFQKIHSIMFKVLASNRDNTNTNLIKSAILLPITQPLSSLKFLLFKDTFNTFIYIQFPIKNFLERNDSFKQRNTRIFTERAFVNHSSSNNLVKKQVHIQSNSLKKQENRYTIFIRPQTINQQLQIAQKQCISLFGHFFPLTSLLICYNLVNLKSNMLPYCLLFLVTFSHAQTCQPQFLLRSVIQDSFDVLNFQTTSDDSTAQYNYPFNRNFFSSLPTPLLSISGLNVPGFSAINYLLSTQVQSNTLVISLNSTKMSWKKATIWLILHSRNDISNKISVISTIPNSNTSLTIKSTLNAQNVVYFSNILGIQAIISNQYSFQIEGFKISGQTVSIAASSNIKANLTIQTIFFDKTVTQFVYGYQVIPVNALSQFSGVWMQFTPVLYSLIGFNSFSFSGTSLQVDLSIDFASNLLQISRSQSFSQLELGFLSIGQPPSQVCAPCNNFISITGCQDTCSSNSYSYNFASGGKTCRSCFLPIGQTLNNNQCSCPNNQVYYQGNCYQAQNLPIKCASNQILIKNVCYSLTANQSCAMNSHSNPTDSSCICDDGYEQYQSQCLKICPQHSTRTTFGICGCNYGYIMNSSKICESICPQNSIYRAEFSKCVCNYNYEMVNGKCSRCANGQFYNSATSKCVAAFYSISGSGTTLSVCELNQVAVNGKCDCDTKSIRINKNCVSCPQSTYKDQNQNQCINCTNYCLLCQNSSICTQCQTGFNLMSQKCAQICGDGRKFTLECDDGNTQDGDGCSSKCQLQEGYLCFGGSPISTDVCQETDPNIKDLTLSAAGPPRYESSGIITNFILSPAVARTDEQLRKMFSYKFTLAETKPKSIHLWQNLQDPTDVQCFFNYHNAPINSLFEVQFTVFENPYGSSKVTLRYDTIRNEITSALANTRNSDRLT